MRYLIARVLDAGLLVGALGGGAGRREEGAVPVVVLKLLSVRHRDLERLDADTGPFKLRDHKPGEYIEFVKNPDYFVKGRPYLDGVKIVIIRDRSTQIAALQAGQIDVAGSGWNKANAETAKQGTPGLVLIESDSNTNDSCRT